MTEKLDALAARLGDCLRTRGFRLATAESCTGGWIAKCATDIAGSSDWFDRGFVTYSNAAKQEMLGVNPATLASRGAVSEAVVREMAGGAVARSQASVAVAVSGIAGPGGGSATKPVGTVCFGYALPAVLTSETRLLAGDRDAVRRASVAIALEGLIARLAAEVDA
jgi:nicotinamide-nucleotide amidase